jgi:hypothetical protein
MATGLLGSVIGSPTPMPNDTYCPTLKCSVEDYTSLAVCAFCETEEIEFGKDSEHCYYEIQKGLPDNDSWTTLAYGDELSGLLPNETITGHLASHADFKTAVTEAGERAVLMRECFISREGIPAFTLNFRMTPQYEGPNQTGDGMNEI